MTRRRVGGAVMAAVLALAAGGCASGTAKLSSKALCENAGGRYVQGMCQPGTARSARDVCLAYGGILMVNEDLCHIPVQ